MQILPQTDTEGCLLRSNAFDESLRISGLGADELERVFRADRARPDWPRIAARGPISVQCHEHDQGGAEPLLPDAETDDMAGGQAVLASGRPGMVHLDRHGRFDDRLLPGPLNLLLAQQWARQGLFPLHAAALRWRNQGVLVLGGQGAGKSSLVLAALDQGARIVSDDWLLVGICKGQARAERLREFLMFRPGLTWDRFGPALRKRLAFEQTADGRFLHAIAENQENFPVWTQLDRCLVLDTPSSSRPATTSGGASDQSSLLAQLIEAAMPMLMTRRFPVERDRLFDRFHALVRCLPSIQVTTGLDLVTGPGPVLDRLLET